MMWGFIPSGKRGCFDLKQIGAVNDVSHCFIKILLLRCNASECIDLIKIMMVAVDKNRLLLDISDSSVAAARKQYLISSPRVAYFYDFSMGSIHLLSPSNITSLVLVIINENCFYRFKLPLITTKGRTLTRLQKKTILPIHGICLV